VDNHWLVGELDERLGEGKSLVVRVELSVDAILYSWPQHREGGRELWWWCTYKRAKARAEATDENKSLHGCDCVEMVVKEGCSGSAGRLKEFGENAEKERRWKNEREPTLELKGSINR
jgi:hypothetical protein